MLRRFGTNMVPGEYYYAPVIGSDRVVAFKLGSPDRICRVVAFDFAGNPLFETDISTPFADVAPIKVSALALKDDDSVVAVVNMKYGDMVIGLDRMGAVTWKADPTGPGRYGTLSPAAIAANNAVYLVQTHGNASNDPLPVLIEIAADGTLRTPIRIATDIERTNGVPPGVGTPVIAKDGMVHVLVSARVKLIDPGTRTILREVYLDKGNAGVWGLIPLPDGTWVGEARDYSSLVQGCGSGSWDYKRGLARIATDGKLQWLHTSEYTRGGSVGLTVGTGGNLLHQFTDCYYGSPAGFQVVSPDGQLISEWDEGYGWFVQVMDSMGSERYVLNTAEDSTYLGPVLYALDRHSHAVQWSVNLECAKEGQEMTSWMGVLPGGEIVLACDETERFPGKGGFYVMDTQVALDPQSPWPTANGNFRASRRVDAVNTTTRTP